MNMCVVLCHVTHVPDSYKHQIQDTLTVPSPQKSPCTTPLSPQDFVFSPSLIRDTNLFSKYVIFKAFTKKEKKKGF